MATLSFDFGFVSNASPAVVLTSTELTGAAAPTVNISKKAFADGTITSVVSGGALTYDSYTKTFGYLLADATPATHRYIGAATTTYATASPDTVQALGIVIPDELVGSRLATTGYTAAPTVGQIRTELAVELGRMDAAVSTRAATGGDGDTLETISDQLDVIQTGTGAITFTYTLTSSVDGTPISGVSVLVYTDVAMSVLVASGFTDAAGQVVFYLNAGTYYLKRVKAGYAFANPDTEAVI